MNRIKEIEDYLYRFLSARIYEFRAFYINTIKEKYTGIYHLKHGTNLMQLLHDIDGILEEDLFFKNLIPDKFATPEVFFDSLTRIKNHLDSYQCFINANLKKDDTSYIIKEIVQIKNDLSKVIDYLKMLYDKNNDAVPYEDLRYNLIKNNIKDFITIFKSILASISYAIVKQTEGYHHSNIHIILKLLGFDIISEELTNLGRIDAVIRFLDKIYILEFKFHATKDLSQEALNQIISKDYTTKYYIENKKIFALGISFSEEIKNINGYKFQEITY